MESMPQVELRSLDTLVPYARNSRTHSDEQVMQIAASIKEFGWTNPVLVDGDNGIIAGHGRILAAIKLCIKKVPVIELAHLTETQRKAYILADNKLALNAGWDLDMLSIELMDLDNDGFDLNLLGFGEMELTDLLNDPTAGLTDPDAVPEVPDDPVSKPGDVWLLEKHRLCCGDSTVETNVSALLGDVKPHLMVTDPPYGVEYDASWRNKVKRTNGKPYNSMATGKVENDDRTSWLEAWSLFPGEVAYVWHGFQQCPVTAVELQECGFGLRALIVWAKSSAPISRGHYHHQHETCWYAVREKGTGHWVGDRKQTTVWNIDKPQKSETGHSAQKPVECMKRPIENNSSPGQAVYEPFSGSGTTIIAGEMTGRSIYAMEISPAYVDMSVERWQNFTGEQAVLEATGKPFN